MCAANSARNFELSIGRTLYEKDDHEAIMKYSIVIPAYNSEKTLEATIESIFACGFEDYEIILVDDGSIDQTPAICEQFAEKYPNIRSLHQPNKGVSAARNSGLQYAAGEYIWFVDADDQIRPLPSAAMENCNGQLPDIILFGLEIQSYRKGKYIGTDFQKMQERLYLSANQLGTWFYDLFVHNYLSSSCNKLFRRRLLLEHHIQFDVSLTNYEDLAFSLQALSVSKQITILPDALYIYKTDYNHDRTVDRIQKIKNLAQNTDVIAEAFFCVSQMCGFDCEAEMRLKSIVFSIYLGLFEVKMQTTALRGIQKQCEDFSVDLFLKECEDALLLLPKTKQKLYRNICEKRIVLLWLKYKYLTLRHTVARFVKPFLKRM